MAIPGWKEGEMRRPEPAVLALLCLGLAGCCTHKAVTTPPTAGSCTPPDTYELNVTRYEQQVSNWCWAASGQMMMEYLGVKVTQCDQANKRFGRSDCCSQPTSGACNQPGWPQPCKYGFTADHACGTALTWDEVKRETYCANKPFAFTTKLPGGGFHMMVAKGYTTEETTKYLFVNDPGPFMEPPNADQPRIYDYDFYVSGSEHTNGDEYYNFTKKN